MKIQTIKNSLVNLEILYYIAKQQKCSTHQLYELFKDKIVRRTLYDSLKKWDLEENIIIRDDFEDKLVSYSHFTIKSTPKLVGFFQNQLHTFFSSIFHYNLESGKNDNNLQLQKDLEDIHKDITIPQILELLKEKGVSDLYSELLEILTKSVDTIILKKIVSDSVKKFQVPEKI